MKVYVSSTFVDLKEYRAAAIKILRQLGHEVVAMEDYVADSAIPLEKVLKDVQSCEVYIGIFAWRYGYIPGQSEDSDTIPVPPGLLPSGDYGQVSITEWEYLQATSDSKRPILSFLLEEGVPWPPHLIDGFEQKTTKDNIHKLRQKLQRQRMVSYFKSPEDLEARVSAAITTINMSARVAVNLLNPTETTDKNLQIVSSGNEVKDSYKSNFLDAVISTQSQRIVRIDIASIWWSTRLYLLSYLVEKLTQVKRILILNGNDFIGLLSLQTIMSHLKNIHPELLEFEVLMGQRKKKSMDIRQEAEEIINNWTTTINSSEEEQTKRIVTPANLKWWFGEAMLGQALKIADLGMATPFDLARIIDFPSEYVPVETIGEVSGKKISVIKVVDKTILNSELARSYLNDLLNRAGILNT